MDESCSDFRVVWNVERASALLELPHEEFVPTSVAKALVRVRVRRNVGPNEAVRSVRDSTLGTEFLHTSFTKPPRGPCIE